MDKIYNPIQFDNDQTPALNEANLNVISNAVSAIDDRVCRLMQSDALVQEAKEAATYAKALYGKENYTEWHGTHAEFQTIKDELIIGSVIHFTDAPKETCIYKGNNVLVPISNYTDSLYIKKQMNNPNLLDNGWFTVNSRGQSSYSGFDTRCVDRWQVIDYSTVGTINSGINLTGSENLIQQLVDNNLYNELLNNIVTFSVMFSDGEIISNSIALLNQNSNVKVVTGKDGFAFGYYSSNNVLAIRLYGTSGKTYNIRAVKLERGSISTLANDSAPNYAEELLRCQTSKADSADTYANKGVATGDAWSSTKSYTSGQCLIHNNVLYKVKTNCTGIEPPNATYYEPTSITSEISNLDKIFYKDNFTLNDRAMLVFPNSSSCYIISLGNFSKTNVTISSLQVYTGSGWVDMNLSSAVIKTVSGFITIENITKLSSANLNAIYPCRFVATLN